MWLRWTLGFFSVLSWLLLLLPVSSWAAVTSTMLMAMQSGTRWMPMETLPVCGVVREFSWRFGLECRLDDGTVFEDYQFCCPIRYDLGDAEDLCCTPGFCPETHSECEIVA